MGFDTYLEVDQRVILMWRKHASATPQPLFQLSDLRIVDDVDDDGQTVVDVRFSTTARGALSNLERAGLGWHAAVAAYAETRVTGYSGGLVMSGMYWRDSAEPLDADRRLAAFDALPGDIDLLNLGQVMLSRWRDETRPDVPLLEDLTYDGALPDGGELVFRVWELARRTRSKTRQLPRGRPSPSCVWTAWLPCSRVRSSYASSSTLCPAIRPLS